MRDIEFLRIKIKNKDFILIDNESPDMAMNLNNYKNYKRLGKLKELERDYIKDIIESQFFDTLNINVYKNYFQKDDDETFSKEWLMSATMSLTSFLLSKKIVISNMVTPLFLEEMKSEMEIKLKNPTFYVKIENN